MPATHLIADNAPMYTRCPYCYSTFRLTAALLAMADGEVRCGSCDAVFNALHSLRDDCGFPDPLTVPPEIEAEATEISPDDIAGETLEFDAPETDWQQFFVQPEVPAHPPDGRTEPSIGDDFGFDDDHAPIAVIDGDEALESPSPVPDTAEPLPVLTEETADADIWQKFLQDTEELAEAPADQSATADAPETGPLPAAESNTTAAIADSTERPARPDAVLDWGPAPVFTPPPRRSRTGLWFAASLVAAIVLAGQAIHYFRDQLSADPRYSELMQKTYSRLGLPLYPQWPLAAYEIRDAKAIAGNSRPDTLDLLAEIAISGTQPVGLPLLRVVLRDRWANTVASHVFEPAQYLAEAPPAFRLYAPGSVIPVTISLQDPGSEAQGYEIDVCLSNRHHGLQCKNTLDPFRR